MRNLSKLSFPGKREDEKVLLLLRRHWVILLSHGIISLILLVVPVGASMMLQSVIPGIQTSSVYPFLVLFFWIYLMFVWVYFFVGWIDYYLDAWIVTNDRIVNIEQNGLFNRVISEQRLYRVQDVTAEVTGPIQTFFNFGKVYIQTAAETERFVFEDVPEPYQVKKVVIELHEKALEAEYARQAAIDTAVATNEDMFKASARKFYSDPRKVAHEAFGHEHQEPGSEKQHTPHPHEID